MTSKRYNPYFVARRRNSGKAQILWSLMVTFVAAVLALMHISSTQIHSPIEQTKSTESRQPASQVIYGPETTFEHVLSPKRRS